MIVAAYDNMYHGILVMIFGLSNERRLATTLE